MHEHLSSDKRSRGCTYSNKSSSDHSNKLRKKHHRKTSFNSSFNQSKSSAGTGTGAGAAMISNKDNSFSTSQTSSSITTTSNKMSFERNNTSSGDLSSSLQDIGGYVAPKVVSSSMVMMGETGNKASSSPTLKKGKKGSTAKSSIMEESQSNLLGQALIIEEGSASTGGAYDSKQKRGRK